MDPWCLVAMMGKNIGMTHSKASIMEREGKTNGRGFECNTKFSGCGFHQRALGFRNEGKEYLGAEKKWALVCTEIV